jgi:hypothetical protein
MKKARCILHDAKLLNSLWGEAFKAACYLKNRLPTRTLQGKTPFEAAKHALPDVSYLRIIGSLAYKHISKEKRASKLTSRTKLGILVGYTDITRMFRIYDPIKHTVSEVRDVIIDEIKRWSGSEDSEKEGYPIFELGSDIESDCQVDDHVIIEEEERDNHPYPERFLDVFLSFFNARSSYKTLTQ